MTRSSRQKSPNYRALLPAALTCVLLALFLAACSTSHQRKAADKEVYGIIEDIEAQIFGTTNAFDIETAYSNRDADTIPPDELINDRMATNRHYLTLEESLDLAINNSRTYQFQKEQLYLTALSLSGERYRFGPRFFAGASAQAVRSPNGQVELTGTPNVGASQLLKSGGNISMSLVNNLISYYNGDARNSAVKTIALEFTQPLLRNFGKNNPAVEALTQAERNVAYAVRDYSFFQNEFAIAIVRDYFAILGLKDVVRNNYNNYTNQVRSTRRLEERAIDREARSDVDLARQSELSAKNNYVNSVADYYNALDAFKITLALPITERIYLDDRPLTELQELGPIPVSVDRNSAYRLAVDRQMTILNAIDSFEDAKRKIKVKANQLKADFNLFANVRMNSETDLEDYTEFDPDNVRYAVGIELDLPIDRLMERNDYRATLIAFERELRNLTLTLDTLRDEIEGGLRTLEQRRQNYLIQQNALNLANERIASNTMLLEAGRVEVRNLVEAQNAQSATYNAVTAALVSYQNSRLQLLLNLGILDASIEEFWFKDPVMDYRELMVTDTTRTGFQDGELVTPEEVFAN